MKRSFVSGGRGPSRGHGGALKRQDQFSICRLATLGVHLSVHEMPAIVPNLPLFVEMPDMIEYRMQDICDFPKLPEF